MKNNKIVVVLDNVRSALNVGAIFRTSDAAGVDELLLYGITPDGEHPKVKKTALGAEEYVKWRSISKIDALLDYFDTGDFTVISIEQTENAKLYTQVIDKYIKSNNIAIIMGNEITGVSPELIERSNYVANLPMLGNKKSLNVATTTGIILYSFRFNK